MTAARSPSIGFSLVLVLLGLAAATPPRAGAAALPVDARLYGVVCDGVADDTRQIQSALNTGLPVQLPPGVCQTSATLTVTTAAQQGLSLIGAGETAMDGQGANKTVIRPNAAVKTAVLIDGSPFGGYAQGVSIRDLTLDMVNMADAPDVAAFRQGQSFDIDYSRVRVTRFGAVKRAWLFGPGAFVTHLDTVQGGLLAVTGAGAQNPTTITCTNCDLYALSVHNGANVTFVGGAIQTPFGNLAGGVIYLPPGVTPINYPSANARGLYAAVMSRIDSSQNLTLVGTDLETSGAYPATFDDGVHGRLPLAPVFQIAATASNTLILNPVMGNMYPLNQSSTTTLYHVAASGVTFEETVTHNRATVINNGAAVFGNAGNFAGRSFTLDASTGVGAFNQVKLKPRPVAGLPGASAAGAGTHAFVLDAVACVFNAPVSGGGAVKCPVVSNGAAWVGG